MAEAFQNLGVNQATELAGLFQVTSVRHGFGHSERIADRFYRSVTNEHFKCATELPSSEPSQSPGLCRRHRIRHTQELVNSIRTILTKRKCLQLLDLGKTWANLQIPGEAGKWVRRDSNPHALVGQGILSPLCLPIPPLTPDTGLLNHQVILASFDSAATRS